VPGTIIRMRAMICIKEFFTFYNNRRTKVNKVLIYQRETSKKLKNIKNIVEYTIKIVEKCD
jgi:hypothetical protein